MSRLIDCDERNSFLFFFPSENIRCQRSSRACHGNLSKKVRRGRKSCPLNPSLRFLLVVCLDLIVCLLAPDGGQGLLWRKRPTLNASSDQQISGSKKNALQWTPVPFEGGIRPKLPTLLLVVSLSSVRQMSAVNHLCPFSKLSIHTWPSSVCKKRKKKGLSLHRMWLLPVKRVVCEHVIILNLDFSQTFQANSSNAGNSIDFGAALQDPQLHPLCLISDSELIYPPYRAQIDKCQAGKPRRDDPACVKRCSIKA